MNTNTKNFLVLLLGGLLIYLVWKRMQVPAAVSVGVNATSSPTSGNTPAAIPGAISGLISAVNSVFTSGTPQAQATPKTL